MAVTEITEMLGSRRRSEDSEGNREYGFDLQVLTDSESDTELIVRAALPYTIGETYPTDSGARLSSINVANEVETRKRWKASIRYSSKTEDLKTESQELNPANHSPLDDATEITWDTVFYQKPARKGWRIEGNDKTAGVRQLSPADPDGRVFVANSAGDVFDPPIEIDDVRVLCTITRNETAPPGQILAFANSVNEDAFTLDTIAVQPFQAKMGAIKVGTPKRKNNILYRQVTYPIHLRAETWFEDLLDAGFRLIENVTPSAPQPKYDFKLIKDAQGQPISAPALLNGFGEQLSLPIALPAGFENRPDLWLRDNAVFLTYDFYRRMPFSALNFPAALF